MQHTTAELPLDTRAGIPDTLAYLRESYPRAGWRHVDNFGQLADSWLQMHDGLRAQGLRLDRATRQFREGKLSPIEFQRAFAPMMNDFLSHLHGHHSIEDQHYFPKFRALDPRMEAGFDLLEADHQTIHAALVASAQSAQQLVESIEQGPDSSRRAAEAYSSDAGALSDLLTRHLADEEDLVIPAILHHGDRSLR